MVEILRRTKGDSKKTHDADSRQIGNFKKDMMQMLLRTCRRF